MNQQTMPRYLQQWAYLFLLTPLVAALVGCASGPDYQRPESPLVTGFTTTTLPAKTAASPGVHGASQQFEAEAVPTEWWKALQSDKLTRLIDQALVASPTLAAAQATLRQAQHNYAATSGATELPQVNAKLGAQRLGTNNAAAGLPDGERAYDLYNATVAVSYDLDLAGGNRRALEALTAQADYQSYQLEGARLTLAANLVLTAITQAQLAAQIDATNNLGSQALTTASLFGAGSLIWSLGGQLVQPLFNPGLRANTKALEAGLDAAKANYQQTVLQSLRNVADVLRTIESDALVQQSLESANASATQALKLVERQYALGSVSYLQLLLSQQQAQQAYIATLDVRARRLSNTVTLYQAMGGGALAPS
jgi:outer membrane protein TolC